MPDCMLLCQHGDDGKSFFTEFPGFSTSGHIDKSLLEKYIAVEQDAGTTSLTHRLAARISEEGYAVGILEVRFPRGIIDSNRITEKSIQNVFNSESNHSLAEELRSLHKTAIAYIESKLSKVQPSLLLDIHSMAHFTPLASSESSVRAVKLELGNMEEYLDAWLNPLRRGERRYVDIITQLNDGTTVGDIKFSAMLGAELHKANIPYRFNNPYPTAPEVMTTKYLQRYPGVAIDIPKDYLADGPLDALEINPTKVEQIAIPIVNAVLKYLKTFPKRN
jgi:predicted N-formylglutamate amidohydrolase